MEGNLQTKVTNLNVGTVPKKSFLERVKKQKSLIFMSIPFVIYVIIFCYTPLVGWLMAFQKFNPAKSLFDQTWV